jgi:hypothetical protein
MMITIMITTATKTSTMSMDWGGGSTFLEEAVTNCNIPHGVKKTKDHQFSNTISHSLKTDIG